MKTMAMALLLVAFSGHAAASGSYDTGNDVLAKCQVLLNGLDHHVAPDLAGATDAGYCAGLMDGIKSTNVTFQAIGQKPIFCPPKRNTIGQNVRIVVKYLQHHPEHLNLAGSVLAIEALAEAFPCSK